MFELYFNMVDEDLCGGYHTDDEYSGSGRIRVAYIDGFGA